MLKHREKILEILAKSLESDVEQLNGIDDNYDLSLIGLTSVIAIEIIVYLENEFDIFIDEEDLFTDNVNTLGKIDELIAKYTEEGVKING
ncbi:acyl carrier protein [Acetivibrio cellulolyticus]|uniref:acyl carrier protein n=1 Tax=Acetivibrio cellulolyticus TaxID=35830 RepID=UPI0001E2E2D4|nr:acyl carrier protein [Acetivibrio cellulolyticus]